jgi:hypothetical protein
MANTILEHNVETGEVIERPMTKAELDQRKADIASVVEKNAAEAQKAADRAALLTQLGITEEQAKLLLG